MKTFIFTCFFALWSFTGYAAETASEAITLNLDPKEQEMVKQVGVADFVKTVVEVGNYFDKNYPEDTINSDLKPDIAKFFPELDTQQLYDRESLIRKSIRLYRWGKKKYDEIKSKILAPQPEILTYRNEDYEKASDYTYQDVGADNVLIVTDFKKVISYSADVQERKNYEEYYKRHKDTSKVEAKFPGIAQLKRIYDKIELKKLPFYGLIYDDPVAGEEGITPWVEKKQAKISIEAENSRLSGQHQIRGVIHFKFQFGWQMLAFPDGKFSGFKADFSESKNIKNCDLFYPTPYRKNFPDGDLITYINDFAAPFICYVQDVNKPAVIASNLIYTLCNDDRKCSAEQTDLSLELKNGNGFSTEAHNFIVQSFTHLPDSVENNIKIQDVSVIKDDNSPSGQTLRIVIDSKIKIKSPEIFVKDEQGTVFGRPRTAIDGDRMTMRLDIISPDSKLEGNPVEITLLVDSLNVWRLTKTVVSSSIFDINSMHLTLGLFLLAVLGGLILNFMPCVFPVLSLKILSLTRFGAKKEQNIRQSFILSVAGIFMGFLLLAIALSLLKLMGHNLGWGLQFQNPWFIVTMIFAVVFFLGELHGILPVNFVFLQKLSKQKFSVKWESFLSGILVVVMSTPCTGPYLGTTIGFALAGTVGDIFVILMAVALGLSIPYLILILAPNLSVFIPRPGAWMQKLHYIMSFMLILTIFWLVSILMAQSSTWTVVAVSFLAVLFYFLLWLYSQTLAEVKLSIKRRSALFYKSCRRVNIFFCSLLLIVFGCALITGYYGVKHRRGVVVEQTQTDLDFNQIGKYVAAGDNVLVKVGADWCLTCSYNDFLVFNGINMNSFNTLYNLHVINIDWTEYNQEILNFMSEYGRRGLPFYILYSRKVPEGLVLPEILSQMEFERILQSVGVRADEK